MPGKLSSSIMPSSGVFSMIWMIFSSQAAKSLAMLAISLFLRLRSSFIWLKISAQSTPAHLANTPPKTAT